MDAAGQFNPPTRSENLRSNNQNGNERNYAKTVNPMNKVHQEVVVDHGKDEHCDQPADQPQYLHLVEANELGVHRRTVDLQNADHGENQNESKEGPVEIAK